MSILPAPLPPFASLRQRVLVPLVLYSLILVLVAGWVLYSYNEVKLHERLQQRGELTADVVSYAVASMNSSGELQRFVTSLGADEDIVDIVVVGALPTRVLASTRQVWLGKRLTALPEDDVADDLRGALIDKAQISHHFNPEEQLFDVTLPLVLDQANLGGGLASRGAVMVHVNTKNAQMEILRNVLLFGSGLLVALLLFVGVVYFQLFWLVLRPVVLLSQYLDRRKDGAQEPWPHVQTEDELLQLGRLLDNSLNSVSRAQRELGNQKVVLDEHAIVSIADADGKIIYVNDAFCKISGYGRSELLGRDHRVVNSGTHSKTFIRDLWVTIRSGKVWRGDICNRARNGSYYWVHTTIAPFLDETGKPYQYVSIRNDITAILHNDAQLKASIEKLNDNTRDVQNLALAASVDLREPLAELRQIGSQLFSHLDDKLDAKTRAYFESASAINEDIFETMSVLAAFARLNLTQRKHFNIDLTLLLNEVAEEFSQQLHAVDGDLDLADLPAVNGDPVLLHQLFRCLLASAVRSAVPNRPLHIRVASEIAHDNDGNKKWLIRVSDNGTGFDCPAGENIPALLQRLRGKTQYQGHALYLAVVRFVAEAHSGSVIARGINGQGASFELTIPEALPESDISSEAGSEVRSDLYDQMNS